MSYNEIFFIPTQLMHYLSEDENANVKVLSLEQYVDKKYITAEKLELPLYFFRQTYLIEGNRFEPGILPSIYYCQQIFNPDIPF